MERLPLLYFIFFFIIPPPPPLINKVLIFWGVGHIFVPLFKLHETLYSDWPLCVNLNVGRMFRSTEFSLSYGSLDLEILTLSSSYLVIATPPADGLLDTHESW